MLEIKRVEQFVILTPNSTHFDKYVAETVERAVASQFSRNGIVDFIVDLEHVSELSPFAIKLLEKIDTLADRESGTLAVVTADENLIEYISTNTSIPYNLFMNLDEAIEFISEDEYDEDEFDEDDFLDDDIIY